MLILNKFTHFLVGTATNAKNHIICNINRHEPSNLLDISPLYYFESTIELITLLSTRIHIPLAICPDKHNCELNLALLIGINYIGKLFDDTIVVVPYFVLL